MRWPATLNHMPKILRTSVWVESQLERFGTTLFGSIPMGGESSSLLGQFETA